MALSFEYVDHVTTDAEDFILRIPAGIRSAADLFDALDSAGRFPDYFGANWGAVYDCLRDFSWITNRNVIIVHSDVPLASDPTACRVYLEILQGSIAAWLAPPKRNVIEPPAEWPYFEHRIRAAFPTETRGTVERIMA
jgi:Barstar (barnase inhibitor)